MDCMQYQFINGVLLHGRYKTLCALNHGSFGLVFKAEDVTTGDLVALKCLTKTSAATEATTTFAIDERSEELAIHRIIGSHPNIVNLVDNFETENHIYLVLEYCPHGDLYEAIRLGRGPGQTETIRESMLQLIDAVEYMHTHSVYHRDIKPENIFLSANGTVKLGDFGLACRDEISYEAAVGSDRYMAPEQMDNDGNGYSPAKADVWAIGICLLNILFSRNPFATPTLSDPLFSDFAADRQTLFDVFPNMSQDTYDILVHSLAIDPEYRSLAGVREAVEKAVLFTTDDESLDEFCAVPATIATANREPLRTPSISSPQVDQGTTFPWAKALALTSPARQLSVIEDVDLADETFDTNTGYDHKYYQAQPDNASMVSFVDSGLGVSIQSTLDSERKMTKSKPVPISGSLPVTAARPIPSLAAVFGKKSEFQSKSWSDLWDEEFEEENNEQSGDEAEIFGRQSMDSLLSVSHGSNTPRAALADLNAEEITNSFVRTPESTSKTEDFVSQDTGFIFEDHTDSPAAQTPTPQSDSRYSPPSKRSIVDKWAALGSRRRAYPTPVKTPGRSVSYATTTPITISTTPQKRARQSSGRKGLNWNIWGQSQGQNDHSGSLSPVANKKEWDMTRDWRQHDKSLHSSHMEAHKGRPLDWVWRL